MRSAGLASWRGHLGGLLAGAAVTAAYAYAPRNGGRALVRAAACVTLPALLALCTWAKVVELTGGAA
ncbi:hypothetical protein I3F60_00310 [Streptomyces sp. MUM 136J]|uniref:hypothetical protein n=1 Tax=Streptomyces sp. MUM 136J TaxID=2791992 RepID=UPI0023D9078B|nr:hypothetical protein [Streptomyces sp. MUM 136J]MCH0567724.1 hypothetical protein [Streptomyces sp. MUM 136J]